MCGVGLGVRNSLISSRRRMLEAVIPRMQDWLGWLAEQLCGWGGVGEG